jgi:hypothetical protein
VDETDWEDRISAAWAAFDGLSEADFLALIEKLAAELPPGRSGIGYFERASSLDSTGHVGVRAGVQGQVRVGVQRRMGPGWLRALVGRFG